ncbi:MAG: hypothetical protein JXA77_10360 [Bacteroidales bacterium]|nr:hypothetical protein [Bacteroidales bacterium]
MYILLVSDSMFNYYHPLHLSVTNMNLDNTNLEIDYSIRLFQDDLASLVGMLYHEALHKNITPDSTIIVNYFKQTLKLSTNSTELRPELVKIESNELEYWLYFKAKLSALPDTLCIENTILTDLYSDQQNLLIFSYRSKEKGLTFDQKTVKQPISLNSIQ